MKDNKDSHKFVILNNLFLFRIRQINDHLTLGLLDLKGFAAELEPMSKRETEKAGTRFLLKKLVKNGASQLDYSEHNKPYLKGMDEHISISHSHDMLAIIVNGRESTGVDIELVREKVKNVQHKFLNEEELKFANENTDRLITLWAAKEALYKVYGFKELEFSRHLRIEDFEGDRIFGNIETDDLKKRYELATELIGEYRLVYVLHEV